jgi:hypothetical protein
MRVCLAGLLLVCLLAANFGAAQEVQFTAVAPRVGQVITRTSTYAMNVDVLLKFAGEELGKRHEDTVETVKKVETVLACKGQAVSSLRVFYETIEETTHITEEGLTDKVVTPRNPLLKRTYVISMKDGSLSFQDSNGKKPLHDELELLQFEYDGFGQPDPLQDFFQNKKIRIGEEIAMPVGLAGEL